MLVSPRVLFWGSFAFVYSQFYGVIPCKREFRLGYWPLKVDGEGHCRSLFLCLGGLVWGPALETRGALVLFVFRRVQIWEGHLSSHAGGRGSCLPGFSVFQRGASSFENLSSLCVSVCIFVFLFSPLSSVVFRGGVCVQF